MSDHASGLSRDNELVPYDHCARWQLHDAYFASRGIGAWLEGEIPYRATNNYTFSSQHAQLLLELVRSLESSGQLSPDEPVSVLEVGGGLGDFAAHFLRALSEDLGPSGRALFARLTYYFSDVSEVTLRGALARPGLAAHRLSGRVVPALFDARSDKRPSDLQGNPLTARPLLIVANYICCILPTKLFRSRQGVWFELYGSQRRDGTEAPSPSSDTLRWQELLGASEWRQVSLEQVFATPEHAQLLQRLGSDSPASSLAYPYAFIDFLGRAPQLMHPQGVLACSDFADGRASNRPTEDRFPTLYGDSLNHAVRFELFAIRAQLRKEAILDSGDGHNDTRTVVLRRSGVFPESVCALFEDIFVRRHVGQDRMDFEKAGKLLADSGDQARALRFFTRALALDPHSAELLFLAGKACMDGGAHEDALGFFSRGRSLDRLAEYDFELLAGQTYLLMQEPRLAIERLQLSIGKAEEPSKYCILGQAYEALGDRAAAYRVYRRALELDPSSRADSYIDALRASWCEEELHLVATADRWWEQKIRELDEPESSERN